MSAAPFRQTHFGPRDVVKETLPDGSILLRSPHPLAPYPENLTQRLRHWAETAPDRVFIARRTQDGAGWEKYTYAETWRTVRSIAAALLARPLSVDRPVVILSENSVEHLFLGLAAMHVGIPYSPVSPAYSLLADDFAKLRHILGLLTPGLVFAQDAKRFRRAVDATVGDDVEVVFAAAEGHGRAATPYADLTAHAATAAVDAAHAAVHPDTIAKILFTSGSTGMPKGVVNTQRMLCSNQQMIAQAFPFLSDAPPTLLDWLPWNHTFGGNHNVGIALYNGGSFYMDDGLPTPAGIEKTVRNLREVSPTIYFNVPKGFEQLLPYLRQEKALRDTFFASLSALFYAGAALSPYVWRSLEELSVQATGVRVPFVTSLGSTETAPAALICNWPDNQCGDLGVPASGLDVKLVPTDGLMEARYRGPSIMPGYWRQPDKTAEVFDADGFYRTGDALDFSDPSRPERGLVFAGRVAENFKLTTGTWVIVGKVRETVILEGAPWVQDVVIAGHNSDFVSVVLFPNVAACRELCRDLPADADYAAVAAHPRMRAEAAALLQRLNSRSTGSANRVERAIFADAPASAATGEVTDKGSINQRVTLKNRPQLVARLYAEAPDAGVIVPAAN